MSLSGKICLVTGAARGLGKIYSETFLQNGAKVILIDILEDEGRQTEHEFRGKYGKENVCFFACDITKYEDVVALYEQILQENGQVDILINNAGVSGIAMDFHQVFEINVFSLIKLTEIALKYMQNNRETGGNFKGIIFNISSIAGSGVCPNPTGIYPATKHAVLGYSASKDLYLCQELDMSIRIYTICPGFVKTELTKSLQDNSVLESVVQEYGGWTDPNLIANVIMKLTKMNTKQVNSGAIILVTNDKVGFVDRNMKIQTCTHFDYE